MRGAIEPPLLEITIGQALEEAAERWGDADALVSVAQGIRWSWRELARRADALAAGLLAVGLEPGDRIGIWSPNCAEWALAQFATARIGLILTTINPAYRTSELEFTVNKVGMKALIAAQRFKSSDYVSMLESIHAPALQHKIGIGGVPRAGWFAFDDISSMAAATEVDHVREIAARLDCRNAVNIQFTSGTTGQPKGATLSHRNILNNGWFVGRAQRLGVGDRICVPVPLYHCFGMVMGNLAGVTCGATIVYPSAGFDPEATLTAIQQERCTALYGVPTMFIAELAHPTFEQFDLTSLRTGVMAGSPCAIEVMKQVIQRMRMTGVTIAYGMTETSPVSFQSAVDDSIERRVSTIGRVQPHLEVRVIDEGGRTVSRGAAGELCTRGYSVMLGYWEEPERTAEVIDAEGWMHTGDLGVLDEGGYGSIVGRIKDMVIRGGENIYPREIEEFLYTHPKVADAQVVGLPDRQMGEELCACIRLASGQTCTEDEIRAFCQGRIAHYKIPRYICFVGEFPLTVSGKVQKFLIREQMIKELNLSTDATA
ncbi:MAG TPA: AMP-binding protein [Steroidobacteraceae bacterium]|nr:AMP-binding protein [Steroidobacteraceae bacterium]